MADEEESVLDTVTAAVNEQRNQQVDPGAQIAAPEPPKTEEPKPDEPKEAVQSDEKGEAQDTRERDSSGRFTTKAPQAEADRPSEDQAEEPKENVPQDRVKLDISRPPKRIDLAVKHHWTGIPEAAREGIWKTIQAEDARSRQFDGLDEYAQKAQQAGTTLQRAMNSYHQSEMAVRNDPIRGVAMILQAVGHDPTQFYQHVADLINNPNAQPPPPMQMPQGITREEVRQLMDEDRINATIKSFADDPDHIYFEEAKPLMKSLLETGVAKDLEDAYNRACKANDWPLAARPNGAGTEQAKKAAAVDKARQAAKATIGAPPSGSKSEGRKALDGSESILDTVKAAYNKARGE